MYKYLAIVVLSAIPSFSHARQYYKDEIYEIENKATEPRKEFNTLKKSSGSGYLIMGEMEYGIAVDSFKTDFLKLSLINGYKFNSFFSLGFGAGMKFYLVEDDADIVVPLFLDFRVNFTDQKISPYLALGIGYSIDIGYVSYDGKNHYPLEAVDLLLNPTAGVKIKIANRTAVNLGIGCEMQSMRFYNDQHTAKLAGNSTCISINAGISF
jgi:hypothetical protein